MLDIVIIWEWFIFVVCWLYVVIVIVWIGLLFYFIVLDLGFKKVLYLLEGVYGEEWQVYGGGFYYIQKYLVVFVNMLEYLIWFKWESYVIWFFGVVFLMMVYWVGGEFYLIDLVKVDLVLWQGILILVVLFSIGWFVYDFLCKLCFGDSLMLLMVFLFVLFVVMGWGYNQVFMGWVVFLYLGVFMVMIMFVNVFFIIILNQKIVVVDLKVGCMFDVKYGKIVKFCFMYNNYLMLLVVFLMFSNYYLLVFVLEYNWVIVVLVFFMGVIIWYYFNMLYVGIGNLIWIWLVIVLLFFGIIQLFMVLFQQDIYEVFEVCFLFGIEQMFVSVDGFEDVMVIVLGCCVMCYVCELFYDGIYWVLKNVFLEMEVDVV